MRRENTQLISAIIKEYIKEAHLEEGLQRVRIFQTWDIVVGEAGAKATTNKFFKDGILYCTISSSIVRTQLYYRKEDIISQINSLLSTTAVKKLVLK